MAAPNFNLAKLPMPARIGVGVAAFSLVTIAYWIFFYTDVSSKIDQSTRQTGQLRSELVSQQQAQQSYIADRDDLAMRQQRQRELNKVLPESTEQAAFLSSIQQVANVSGLSLNAWQPLEEKNETFFAKVPMRLDMRGHFHQVAKFAYEIGKLDRIINV
jgi:type IV pilus assembly protein PilO